MEEAIKNRDFASFTQLTCTDSNQFHAVCLDTSPPIFYMNDTSHRYSLFWHISICCFSLFVIKPLFILIYQTVICFSRIISLVEKWNRSEGTPQVKF